MPFYLHLQALSVVTFNELNFHTYAMKSIIMENDIEVVDFEQL